MTASCYLCEKGGHATLPDTSVGDAVGACKLCGVLACLGHGQRDGGRPAYICGICLANLLAAASTKQIPAAEPKTPPRAVGNTPPPADGERKPQPATTMGYAQWAAGIDEPRDVIDDYDEPRWASVRNDAEYLARALSGSDLPRELRVFAAVELEQARVLMGAALAIATKLNLTSEEMIPQLRPVANAFFSVRR